MFVHCAFILVLGAEDAKSSQSHSHVTVPLSCLIELHLTMAAMLQFLFIQEMTWGVLITPRVERGFLMSYGAGERGGTVDSFCCRVGQRVTGLTSCGAGEWGEGGFWQLWVGSLTICGAG